MKIDPRAMDLLAAALAFTLPSAALVAGFLFAQFLVGVWP